MHTSHSMYCHCSMHPLPFAPLLPTCGLLHPCCFMHITHLLPIFLSYILRSVCTHFFSLVLIINAFTHTLVPAPCSTPPPPQCYYWAFIPPKVLLFLHFHPSCSCFPSSLRHPHHYLYTPRYPSSSCYPHHHHPHNISSYSSPSLHFSLLLSYILLFSSISSYIFGTTYVWPSSVILWLFAVFVSPRIISQYYISFVMPNMSPFFSFSPYFKVIIVCILY